MSYNKQYNTRNSGRYNTPGQFVPASETQQMQSPQPFPPMRKPNLPGMNQNQNQNQNHNQNQSINNHNLQSIQTMDIEMKHEPAKIEPPSSGASAAGSDTPARPFWMKSKLAGVKKVSNKERRRRQNENLRKLLTPKNALMVLNEMLPNEQLANQFKVEPASQFNNQYYTNKPQVSFCADLTINGNTYKGYGENKLTARNLAAEQAIRDLIIQRMNKLFSTETPNTGAAAGAEPGSEEGDEEALPMIQLASFALHKLFSEWEYEGHKVPQLKPPSVSISETGSEAGAATPAGAPAAPKPKAPKKKELPPNAASMHPCMLLTYMRPHLEYRELAVTGDRQQSLVFTLGVDVDGATYIGKASNKKEARKQAAKSACQEIFGVRFIENPTDNAPKIAA